MTVGLHFIPSSILLLLFISPIDQGEMNPAAWAKSGACGANSLFVLLELQDVTVVHGNLLEELAPDPFIGNSIEQLAEVAQRHGVKSKLRRVDVGEFTTVPLPFIAHLNGLEGGGTGHFITVYDIASSEGDDVIFYFDGTSCLPINTNFHAMRDRLSGAVLVVSPPVLLADRGKSYKVIIAVVLLVAVLFFAFRKLGVLGF